MEKEIIEIRDRLAKLEKAVFTDSVTMEIPTGKSNLDFSINERAFIKKYSSGFNGQEFFTLITAYLSKGDANVSVNLMNIKNVWKSCFGTIGVPYASIFSTRAKENSWVDSSNKTRAAYVIGKHWKDILKKYEQNS